MKKADFFQFVILLQGFDSILENVPIDKQGKSYVFKSPFIKSCVVVTQGQLQ